MKVKLKTNKIILVNKKEVNIITFRGREYQVQVINDKYIVVSSNQIIKDYYLDMYITKHRTHKEYWVAKRCYINVGKYYSYVIIDNEFQEVVDLYFKLKESDK